MKPIDIIHRRLEEYACESEEEELNAIREILQELILAGLARTVGISWCFSASQRSSSLWKLPLMANPVESCPRFTRYPARISSASSSLSASR